MKINVVLEGERLDAFLSASATIDDADEILRAFRDIARRAHSAVRLDVSAVAPVDVTFFQLLISLKNAITSEGRAFTLKGCDADCAAYRTASLLGISLDALNGNPGGAR